MAGTVAGSRSRNRTLGIVGRAILHLAPRVPYSIALGGLERTQKFAFDYEPRTRKKLRLHRTAEKVTGLLLEIIESFGGF
jgi:hypothetical protein